MKLPSLPGSTSTKLLLLVFGVAGAFLAFVLWDTTRTVEALWRENTSLHEALARLQEEETVGYLWLLMDAPQGRREVAWLEVPAGGGETPAHFHVLALEGREVFVDGLVVKVPGQLVADGEGRALVLWRRAFGSAQSPESGVELQPVGELPRRYQTLLGEVFEPVDAERFWGALWDLAHDPDQLSGLGVEAIYGNALSVDPRPGYFYTVRLSAAGTLSLLPAPMSDAPTFLPPVR